MKIVGFHTNELNERGTNVAVYDYAHYNETILGNKSFIISNRNADLTALKKFQDRFEVFLYNDFSECTQFCKDRNIQYVYYVKAGDRDGKIIPECKSCIHAVFQHREEHGDAYAYISQWLAKQMKLPGSYVPYMVDMPSPKISYRSKLKIPEDAIVIGRHGGYTEFDLQFVHRAINDITAERKDIYFLLMNTKPFTSPNPNIIHISSTYNMQNKSDFINTCDYMIHGRNMGESFGLAISEFLFHDKPVISWHNGQDKNHIELMKDKGIWYNTEEDLKQKFKIITKNNKPVGFYKTIVDPFKPELVMKQFDKIFLNA
jgi:hypothetical protein